MNLLFRWVIFQHHTSITSDSHYVSNMSTVVQSSIFIRLLHALSFWKINSNCLHSFIFSTRLLSSSFMCPTVMCPFDITLIEQFVSEYNFLAISTNFFPRRRVISVHFFC